jgi:hypothetical protein
MKHPYCIRFLSLPTYAPGANPMEKHWLKLSRTWLRFHPYARRQAHIPSRKLDGWLSRHCDPSPALLHEVGNYQLYLLMRIIAGLRLPQIEMSRLRFPLQVAYNFRSK